VRRPTTRSSRLGPGEEPEDDLRPSYQRDRDRGWTTPGVALPRVEIAYTFFMSDPYAANYHKITTEAELQPGRPVIFRAAGATLVLRRGESGVEAIDGSCLSDDGSLTPQARIDRIQECVAAGVGSQSKEWSELVRRAGLPVRVSDGVVWVCIDACSK
jgi:hypothetical protein